MSKSLLIICIGLPLCIFAVNPGDNGLEIWRNVGQTAQEQMEESGLNTYYPSRVPFTDNCLYWTFEHNCSTCIEYYKLPDHDGSLRRKDIPGYKPHWNPPYIFSGPITNDTGGIYRHLIGGDEDMSYANSSVGHGFKPIGPYNDFIYVRLFNDYIGGNSIYFNPGDDVTIPAYMKKFGSSNGRWLMIGSGHFPPYAPVTIKIRFCDREDLKDLFQTALTNGTEQFKTSEWTSVKKHYEHVGYEDPKEYNGEWYTNSIYDITYTTNIIKHGTIYWVEYHLDGEIFRKTYNRGGDVQYQAIPSEYEDLPDRSITSFKPYGDNPTFTFVAKPTKYTAQYGSLKVEYYNLLYCTNLVEGTWVLDERIKVYGNNLITVPLNIAPTDMQGFWKLSDYMGIYPVHNNLIIDI